MRNDGRDTVETLRWGVRGRINIRAESIIARRSPVRRRCIEFADGFYEWKDRRPYYYTLRSGEPFAFAGLWEPLDGTASLRRRHVRAQRGRRADARSHAGHADRR